jgi:DNA-directed RNA polymerase subunit RPC12/RpoP
LRFELQRIYDSEINVRIGWFWDAGIDVRLGDEMNGFEAEETVRSVDEIVPSLQEAIAHFYPDSTYAASLSPEVRERCPRRLFHPPRIGVSVRCPHCGSPNACPFMDETFAFVCNHCGESVEVQPPKIQ